MRDGKRKQWRWFKKESEIWELINKERKRRKGLNGNIEMEEIFQFLGLLRRVNNRIVE